MANDPANVYKGNFEFVKDIYPDIYDFLYTAESEIRIDYYASGRSLRSAFEAFLNDLVKEYRIRVFPEKGNRVSLNDNRMALEAANKLPVIPDQEYITVKGKTKKGKAYAVLQKTGNRSSHVEAKDWDPELNYQNLLTALRIMHSVLSAENKRKKGKQAGNFKPNCMPIGDNYIISSEIPLDNAVSHCIMEYETCSYTDTGRIDKYGIIRVFEKNRMDEKLLQLRDAEAFREAASDAGIQFDGNVQVELISKMNSSNSDFYIVAYKFSKKPHRLNDSLLKTMEIKKRVELCVQVSEIINKFHTLDTPIYHRNISFDCIYVCENKKGELEPSIIKLDCAKIDSEEFGTVIANVQNMQTRIRQQQFLKYSAPEVRALFQGSQAKVNWEKADVYSLGVLFGDILNGKIETGVVPSMKLQRAGVNMSLIQLIDKMKHPNPELRPDTNNIIAYLEEME